MNSLDWARYRHLRDSIVSAVAEAVEENGGWDDGGVTIAISPDLDEVVARFMPWWEFGDCDGWNTEHAGSMEEAEGIADMYFDFR